MPRKRLNPDKPVTPSQGRAARLKALREAGGWAGRVELPKEAMDAIFSMSRGRSISATISDALLFYAACGAPSRD